MNPLETVSSKGILLIPAQNMYAVGPDGERIDPSPSARTGPSENLIMNVGDENRFLYHYTSFDTAKKILNGLSLRMGDFQGTNDPKESKEWHFDLYSKHADFRDIDAGKLSSELSGTIKKHSRVLCFCEDSVGLTGCHLTDVSLRGHFKARMWAQYGGNHAGVCLVFNRNKLIEKFKIDCGDAWFRSFGKIRYQNRPVTAPQNDRDYFIDYDALKSFGFERYWKLHAQRYHQRLFFEKALDWRDECEFRLLAVMHKPIEVFVGIQDCLVGVFLGEKCNIPAMKDLIGELMDRGVHVMGVSWRNCTPWYDFGNQIYNFSARALEQEIRNRECSGERLQSE